MSDAHHDPSQKTSGPGHEVDAPPTKELFNIVWGLGGLTLLSIATCAQLFYQQARDIAEERGNTASYQLGQYREEMKKIATGNGEIEFKDSNGNVIKQKYRPLDAARAEVLGKSDGLKAAKAPQGWVHPDDIAAGGQGGTAATTNTPEPTPGVVPVPADGQPNPDGALPHPLGEPNPPPNAGPVDPTSAEPIRTPPTEAPPPTPSVPAANPTPNPAPPVQPTPSQPLPPSSVPAK